MPVLDNNPKIFMNEGLKPTTARDSPKRCVRKKRRRNTDTSSVYAMRLNEISSCVEQNLFVTSILAILRLSLTELLVIRIPRRHPSVRTRGDSSSSTILTQKKLVT